MSIAFTANLSPLRVESSILQLEGITKRYSSDLPAAVSAVSLQLQQGKPLYCDSLLVLNKQKRAVYG
jgi:hypothetical protein